MRKEIADKWVSELRSGNYEQGQQYLCRKNDEGKESYCCLGVLCELYIKEGYELSKEINPNNLSSCYMYGGQASAVLPTIVQVWAGIQNDFGKFGDEEGNTLVELNDRYKKNFQEIADTIEANYGNI